MGPLYQLLSADSLAALVTFSPDMAPTGTYESFDAEKPICCVRNGWSLAQISSKRACDHETASSLLTATTSCWTPNERTSNACSRVCPCPSSPKPLSNAPEAPSTTSTAASAILAPLIMLGTKSRWPGASMSVNALRVVSNASRATSIVTPLLRSSSVASRAQACANDALPARCEARSFAFAVLSETTPSSCKSRPINVDLPASTWPTTTRLSPGLVSASFARTSSSMRSLEMDTTGKGLCALDELALVPALEFLSSKPSASTSDLRADTGPAAGLPPLLPGTFALVLARVGVAGRELRAEPGAELALASSFALLFSARHRSVSFVVAAAWGMCWRVCACACRAKSGRGHLRASLVPLRA